MSLPFKGSVPRGASVVSGVISALTAINAGDITINAIPMVAFGVAPDAATRTQNLVDTINAAETLTGVKAVRVTATTFSLNSGAAITIAALGATATLAACGLTAGTTALTPVLLATRKSFGTDVVGADDATVHLGGADLTVKAAKNMGLLSRFGSADTEISPPAAHTTTGG